LEHPREIVDEYVARGFQSIFYGQSAPMASRSELDVRRVI
jgi:hypothetical protein